MNPRISLDDSIVSDVAVYSVQSSKIPAPSDHRQLASTDWDRSTPGHLNLFLPDEPRIGDQFSYNGVQWQVVDYSDGWVARILL